MSNTYVSEHMNGLVFYCQDRKGHIFLHVSHKSDTELEFDSKLT